MILPLPIGLPQPVVPGAGFEPALPINQNTETESSTLVPVLCRKLLGEQVAEDRPSDCSLLYGGGVGGLACELDRGGQGIDAVHQFSLTGGGDCSGGVHLG